MRLPRFTLLAIPIFLLLSIPAYAGDEPPSWMTTPSGGVTVLHTSPGIDYLYDDKGHTATIYGTDPILRRYSTQDTKGKMGQGYLFDPVPRTAPLRSPESLAYPSPYPPATLIH